MKNKYCAIVYLLLFLGACAPQPNLPKELPITSLSNKVNFPFEDILDPAKVKKGFNIEYRFQNDIGVGGLKREPTLRINNVTSESIQGEFFERKFRVPAHKFTQELIGLFIENYARHITHIIDEKAHPYPLRALPPVADGFPIAWNVLSWDEKVHELDLSYDKEELACKVFTAKVNMQKETGIAYFAFSDKYGLVQAGMKHYIKPFNKQYSTLEVRVAKGKHRGGNYRLQDLFEILNLEIQPHLTPNPNFSF